jgi:D-sedoheptulose 7-phosphate isomerase
MTTNNLAYVDELIATLRGLDSAASQAACSILLSTYDEEGVAWIGGNGGNSANASHFATDWNKGLFTQTGKALKSHSLWENPSLVSALANDQSFELIYSDQLLMWAKPGDVAVLLSGGGGSKNIMHAARTAKSLGLTVIGLTGGVGLQHAELFDCHIHVPTDHIQIVEDVHAIFGHIVYEHIRLKRTL